MRLLQIILLFCPMISIGQNLVPNYSFEDTTIRSTPLYAVKNWRTPTQGSPDFFIPLNAPYRGTPDNFAGAQYAKSGVAYMGLLIYSLYANTRDLRREYIQAKLTRPLKFDTTYCLRLYVSLADSMQFASRNQLGVYISNTAVSANTNFHLPYTPQIVVSPSQYITDKTNWVEFNFQYQAQGGEEYITIGNFNDTTLLDTMYVGGGNSSQLDYVSTYYYLDDLWLSHCDSVDFGVGINNEKLGIKNIELWPNPTNGEFTLETKSKKPLSFQLYNVLGSFVPYSLNKSRDLYHFSVGDIPKGIYFLKVDDGEEQASFKLLKQ